MITSFYDKETEKIWNREFSKKFSKSIQKIAYRKLILIHSAVSIEELKIPPGNRLHKLIGNRKGQYSISINDQFRICFDWDNGNALNVEITDYH